MSGSSAPRQYGVWSCAGPGCGCVTLARWCRRFAFGPNRFGAAWRINCVTAVGRCALGGVGDVRDGPAFAAWVRPHLDALSAVAVRQVGRSDAADVVQDALMRAWQRWDTYAVERGTPRAWLVSIVLDQARRFRVRHPRFRDPDAGRDISAVSDEGDAVTDRVDVEAALDQLPRRQREVVALFYLADLSVTEVSSVLGISAGTVKSHLTDARTRLRTIWGTA